MATVNYTSLLGLALPTTGDLSGQWGNEVNEYISKYVDASVAGTQTISGSQTAVTLSPTNGASLVQAAATSSGSSQYAIINCTGNPASTLTITVTYSSLTNAQFSKTYAVINATSTSQSVVVRATTSSGTSSGVTVASGERCLITWNGSNFVKVSSTVALPAGSTTQVQYNNAGALAGSANLTFDGTTLTVNNLTDSSLTSGRVTYATTGGNLTDSANFTFDGSNLQIGSQGDLRLGDSDNSNWVAFQAPATVASNVTWTLPSTDGTNGQALTTNGSGTLSWTTAVSSQWTTSGSNIYYDTGNVGINTTGTIPKRFTVNGGTGAGFTDVLQVSAGAAASDSGPGITFNVNYNNYGGFSNWQTGVIRSAASNATVNFRGYLAFYTNNGTSVSDISEKMRITSEGFTRPVAYADTVSALGNTGTATTINLQNGNVFTATLTGNCTFTLSNPIATGSSSFTLILTNDGTAGRTVAWAGGAFRFPGGAASLSRTTTANAVDIWVFFTPDGGTTWYGNIAMKNMAA